MYLSEDFVSRIGNNFTSCSYISPGEQHADWGTGHPSNDAQDSVGLDQRVAPRFHGLHAHEPVELDARPGGYLISQVIAKGIVFCWSGGSHREQDMRLVGGEVEGIDRPG